MSILCLVRVKLHICLANILLFSVGVNKVVDEDDVWYSHFVRDLSKNQLPCWRILGKLSTYDTTRTVLVWIDNLAKSWKTRSTVSPWS